MTLVPGIITLAFLGYIIRLAITGRKSFSLTRAMGPIGSFEGDAIARLLAMMTITGALVTTSDLIPTATLERFAIPAILAVSHNTFIVFSSNAFAILGLRSLYFLLNGMHDRFRYLNIGLGIILAFYRNKESVNIDEMNLMRW